MFHYIFVGILGKFNIILAPEIKLLRHYTWEDVIWTLSRLIRLFFDDGYLGSEIFEASKGQCGAARQELQEVSAFLFVHFAENLYEIEVGATENKSRYDLHTSDWCSRGRESSYLGVRFCPTSPNRDSP